MKTCHITSVHDSSDVRICEKECKSLVQAGYEVYLVAPGISGEERGIHIIGIGEKPKSRIVRMTKFSKLAYTVALELDCDVYHIHDPELLPYAVKLAKQGKKVVYDSHEDYPSTMEAKAYLPVLLRKLVSWFVMKYEFRCCKRFNAVVCCYHWTKERLSKACKRTELIFNFPIVETDGSGGCTSCGEGTPFVCYAGGISKQWNIDTVIKSLAYCSGVQFRLAGDLSEENRLALEALDGWKYVDYVGRLPFQQVSQRVYSGALAGMALLDYIPQCKNTVGNLSNTKLFEYMLAGLPVICTDFDLWKKIINEYSCGICVNPHDAEAVADAICFMKDHPEERNRMGNRARQAVLEKYNWKHEEQKLLKVYEHL